MIFDHGASGGCAAYFCGSAENAYAQGIMCILHIIPFSRKENNRVFENSRKELMEHAVDLFFYFTDSNSFTISFDGAGVSRETATIRMLLTMNAGSSS